MSVLAHVYGSPPRSPYYTVLVVEDDVLIRFTTADCLTDAGYLVYEAANLEEALVTLESGTQIDLVVTDVDLDQGKEGLSLASTVKEKWPAIPVALVSGFSGSFDPTASDGFLSKPYREGDLIAMAQKLTESRGR